MLGRRLQHSGGGSGLRNITANQGPRSFVKSIQSGTITLTGASSNTATITAVDLNNSILIYLGHTITGTDNSGTFILARAELTNATTVTASRGGTTNNVVLSYSVIEFYPGYIRSVQRGTITIADAATSGTATLATTLQTITKAWCTWLGTQSGGSNSSPANYQDRIVLTNTTTVTANRNGSTNAHTIGYQVVEFY